ncbi:MAG TPA: A/G-specific adenine glycosylase [Candidatus Nanoarchaeia archaeon]|nr:A/G-specific adenine glycosylase [Candidatus Nanoarchaeia archaeon]
MTFTAFRKTIWTYYKANKRDFPWRETKDPYKILVSEIMLQQTQAPRVVPKYNSFLEKFPTVQALAKAKLSDVLAEWQGLGYNRRGMYLKQCAEKVVTDYGGEFPKDFDQLVSLPGIGPATAGDVLVFTWNIPMVVIETNIRSVFIHFFFKDKEKITDKEILPLIEKTLDKGNPREWYWALFDYGTFLKKTANPSRRSAHHVKQTKFVGSLRQKRAVILREIIKKPQNQKQIVKNLGYETEIVSKILLDLEKEGFTKKTKTGYMIV